MDNKIEERKPVHVEVEQPGADSSNWLSRKFWSACGSAFAVIAFSMIAKWFFRITEASMEYLITISLIAVAGYCGFNIVDKLGGIGALLRGPKK